MNLRQPAAGRRWLVLVFIAMAQLMVILDMTIVNIALPSAQEDLGFADGERQWIVTAYALAFGSLLLVGGRLGDLFGRKWAFIIGLAGFAGASALGGAATSFEMLVTSRALQGAFGALLAPAALSTLISTFPEPRDRAKAFGIFGSVAGAGSATGLVLGGVLTEYLDWRWCLYVNLVFAAVAAAGALVLTVNVKPMTRPHLDLVGTALASAGLFGLVFGFSRAESSGWSAGSTVASLSAAAMLLTAFVLVEQRRESPLLPLRIVTDRTRAGAFTSVAVLGVASMGALLFLTFWFQQVKGFSPVEAGLAFLPMTACIVLSSNVSNLVTLPRFGRRAVITTGMVLGAIAMFYLAQIDTDSGYAAAVLPALMVLGLGFGMIMAPGISTATVGVDPRDAGVASAMVNTMQQVGGSVGTALLSTIAASSTAGYHDDGREFASSATHGYTVAFDCSAALFALGAILALVMLPTKQRLETLRAAAPAPVLAAATA